MKKLLTLFACGLVLAGCDTRGAVNLTIEAPETDRGALLIPQDVESIRMTMRPSTGEAPVLEKDYVLDPAKHRFPLTLGIEAGEYEGDDLVVEVRALKGERTVAEASATVQFDPEELTSFTIRLVAAP